MDTSNQTNLMVYLVPAIIDYNWEVRALDMEINDMDKEFARGVTHTSRALLGNIFSPYINKISKKIFLEPGI